MAIPPYLRKEHVRLMPQNLAAGGKQGRWYEIKAQADTAEVFIYDEIGGWGILAADFVRELQAIDAKQVKCRISSPGGSVFEALAIYASLKNFDGTVECVIDGLCASAATVIAMAGDSITTAPGSMWMVHDALGACMGNATDMQQMCDLLDKTSQNIADIYAERAGGTAADWRTTMQAETWYTSDEAVTAGLADGLTENAKVTAKNAALITASAPKIPEPPTGGFAFDAEMFRNAVREAVS